jgi:TonB family protein
MDFAAKKKMDAKATTSLTSEEAHPKAGWNAFQKYMSTVAISPDGKCGDVKLTFTVDANGVINDCKVVTGLSEAADKKAVELIKNGPKWVNTTDAKAVSVTVNFHRLHTATPDFL